MVAMNADIIVFWKQTHSPISNDTQNDAKLERRCRFKMLLSDENVYQRQNNYSMRCFSQKNAYEEDKLISLSVANVLCKKRSIED